MNNIVIGCCLIVFNAIGYYAAWQYFKKNEVTVAILLISICGFSLRLFCSHDAFLHPWDERYHALAAKHLLNHWQVPLLYTKAVLGYDPADWMTNYYWVHKPPLPIYTIAATFKLFGINELALRLPSILLTTIGIIVIYKTGTFFKNKKIGFYAACLYSINGLIIEISSGRVATDHVDVFFLFFVSLAILFTLYFAHTGKKYFNILVGISLGLAVLSKWLPAFIVLPIWLLIVWESGKLNIRQMAVQLTIIIAISCILFLPWQWYIFHYFPVEAKAEAEHNVRHIFEVLAEKCTGPWYYFLNQIRINYGELIYLPIIWFFYKSYKAQRNLTRWAICLWFLVPFLFFSYAVTKMQAYILFTCPALFLMTAEFYCDVQAYNFSKKFRYVKPILLFLLIALPIRYAIERVKPFRLNDNQKWVQDLKKLKQQTDSNTVLFNYSKPIDAMFYTNIAAAYSSVPSQYRIDSLVANNYKVWLPPSDLIKFKNCKGFILSPGPSE
jgi:4-amino-4-deoxy-L-arabinose transferase-like glycosyltransferase